MRWGFAAMSRYKRVIGDALKSRQDDRRTTEVAIAVKSLNPMNELGRAKFVRVALNVQTRLAKAPCNKVSCTSHGAIAPVSMPMRETLVHGYLDPCWKSLACRVSSNSQLFSDG
jgi:hypothetical protein